MSADDIFEPMTDESLLCLCLYNGPLFHINTVQ